MACGTFTGREKALATVDQLLAPGSSHRLLVVYGEPGQGKSTLLKQVSKLHAQHYQIKIIDLDLIVMLLKDVNEATLAAGTDEVAVMLLQDIGEWLASQARWWQRPKRRMREAWAIGQERSASRSFHIDMKASDQSQIEKNLIQFLDSGPPETNTIRRRRWIRQLDALARRFRRRRLLLLVDACEWMYVFDEVRLRDAQGQPIHGNPLRFGPFVLGQVLPQLLRATPRMKVIMAGSDPIDKAHHNRVPALEPCKLTGWTEQDTRSFLLAAGVDDPDLAALVHRSGNGLPLVAEVFAAEFIRWKNIGGTVDMAALRSLIRSRPASRWVPEMIFAQVGTRKRRVVEAAAVLRMVTMPALQVLLRDYEPDEADWFHRLTSRPFLQQQPASAGAAPGESWRMHSLIRLWVLRYLTGPDVGPDGGPARQRLPNLHARAAAYFTELTDREGHSRLEVFYHLFAMGDGSRVDIWKRGLLAAVNRRDLFAVTAHTEVALAPEQFQPVRRALPAVTAIAQECEARVDLLRSRLEEAENRAVDAAKLYAGLRRPAEQARALRFASRAAAAQSKGAQASEYGRQAGQVNSTRQSTTTENNKTMGAGA